MTFYTYLGPRRFGDTGSQLIITGSDGLKYLVAPGQSVDISTATYNELNVNYILTPGSTNPAGLYSPSSPGSAGARNQVWWDTSTGKFVPQEADDRAMLGSGGGGGGSPTGAAGGVLAGTYPNPTFSSDMATQAELDAHINDTSDAHDASAISYAGGTGMSAADVEGAIDELATEKENVGAAAGLIATHEADLSTHGHPDLSRAVVSNVYTGSAWPARPAVAAGTRVDWVATTSSAPDPAGGAGGPATGDMLFKPAA